jgi:hypothetical protein
MSYLRHLCLLCIVVSNTYYVVFLFRLSSSCVPYVVSLSRLSSFDCPSVSSKVYLEYPNKHILNDMIFSTVINPTILSGTGLYCRDNHLSLSEQCMTRVRG